MYFDCQWQIVQIHDTTTHASLTHEKLFTFHSSAGVSSCKCIQQILFSTECSISLALYSGILMAFLFPMLQCMCLYVAVSDKAMNLQLGVVNEEVPNWLDCYDELLVTAHVKDYECNLSKISCRYLRAIDAEYIKLRHYDSVAKAYRESRKANVIGFIHFASNFTKAFKDIMDNGRDAMNSSFVDREIRVRLDFSNQPVVEFLRHKLYEAYSTFAQNLMTDCGLSKALASTPVTVHQQFKIDRREYVAIGFLLM